MRVTCSNSGIDFIKRWEDEPGFLTGLCTHLVAYQCPAGAWTIGWGHTESVVPGMQITQQKADSLLSDVDVPRVCSALGRMFPDNLDLTQGQQDALVSLCFNMRGGPWALPRIAPKLWDDLKRGLIPQAAHEFLDIDHALVGGRPVELSGLRRRREAEAKMFLGVAA